MTVTYAYTNELIVETCCNCHMDFAMPGDFQRARRKDKQTFHCPAGHPQHYIIKSEEQKLRAQLAQTEGQVANERRWRLEAEKESLRQKRIAAAAKGRVTKMRRRIAAGVCPCCNRSFKQVVDHMRKKHPETLAELSIA